MKRRRVLGLGAALVAVGALAGCQAPQPWSKALLSTDAAGTDSGNGYSYFPVLSPDGTRVAYMSFADDQGPTDTNGFTDVYLRDLVTGAVTLVSHNAAGTDSANAGSGQPVFSADGTKLAFESSANDLGPADAGVDNDVYVRDLVTGATTLVSVNAAGTDGGNGSSHGAVLTPDGDRIVFISQATDLGPADTADDDVYVRDLVAGTTSLVSVNTAGTRGGNFFSHSPSISDDGTKVVFESFATDLVAGDTGFDPDAFLRDLTAGTTRLVSVGLAGGGEIRFPGRSAITGDGTRVVFDGSGNVLLHDLSTSVTRVVTRGAGGAVANGDSLGPVLNPDDTVVAYTSDATNLGPQDTNGVTDLYITDLATGATTLVSARDGSAATGGPDDAGPSYGPTFSADGSRIAFESLASNLGPEDSDRQPPWESDEDVYVRDLTNLATTLVSTNAAGTDSASNRSQHPLMTPDGSQVVFMTEGIDLGPVDSNFTWDVFVATLQGADLNVTVEPTVVPISAGGQITYDVTVTNGGPDTAQDTTASVLLSGGTDFLSASGTCAAPSPDQTQVVTCAVGDLAAGDTAHITVTAHTTAGVGTVLATTTAVVSPTLDPDGRGRVVTTSTAVI